MHALNFTNSSLYPRICQNRAQLNFISFILEEIYHRYCLCLTRGVFDFLVVGLLMVIDREVSLEYHCDHDHNQCFHHHNPPFPFFVFPCSYNQRCKFGAIFFVSIIDQQISSRRIFEVHCNYNWEICQKLDLVITLDWGVLLAQGQPV